MAISRFKTSTLAQGLPKYQKLWDGTSSVFDSDYELITRTTVGAGGSSTITFSSIPNTYKHLQIRVLARSNYGGGQLTDYLKLRYNSDSGANYSVHVVYGNGSSVTALGFDNQSENWIQRVSASGATASAFGSAVVDILDYANTSKYKTMRNLGGVDNNGTGLTYSASGSWRNTAAISSISIEAGAGSSLDQYSSFALYGIKGI